jgi:hypothetical protein
VALKDQVKAMTGPTYRRWRRRLDNPEVRKAGLLAQRLRTPPPLDILHLGASESLYVAPYDEDQRTLVNMLADALPPEVTFYSVHFAGYNPSLYLKYLDIVACYPVKPVVVLSLTIRFGYPPWDKHPEYSYQRASRALGRIDPGSPPWRFHAPVRLTRESDFVELDRIVYPTVAGSLTIGEFRRTLKDTSENALRGDERTRRLYGYHQGGVLGEEFLASVTELGRRLRELELPAVVYYTPVPVERGVELLGEELRERVVGNFKLLDEAFIKGYGPIDIVQTGTFLDSSEFINPEDAIEHANEHGRKRIADLIIEAIRAQRAGMA